MEREVKVRMSNVRVRRRQSRIEINREIDKNVKPYKRKKNV